MRFRDWPAPSTLPVDGGLGEVIRLVILAFLGATLSAISAATAALADAIDDVRRGVH